MGVEALPTHRELCQAATAWLLALRDLEIATWELGCGLAVPELQADGLARVWRGWDGSPDRVRWRAGVLDAVGISDPMRRTWRQALARARPGARAPKVPAHRVVVVECKVSRSDLLADMRAGKMLGYQSVGTHCYLALGRGVLQADKIEDGRWRTLYDFPTAAALAELRELGLPASWGVALATPHRYGGAAHTHLAAIRQARHGGARPTTEGMISWQRLIARNLTWRAVRGELEEAPADDQI